MMNALLQIKEALRIFRRARRFTGFRSYPGGPWQICGNIVADCWSGQYYTTSMGHFKQFYSRDFGMCCESLIKLGHKQRVDSTLRYALDRFLGAHKITTHITPSGKVVDFPNYTPESLAYILHSLSLIKNKELTAKYGYFLEREADRAFNLSIDKDSGLIYKHKNFSTMKDNAVRQSPIYLNCMVGMTSSLLDKLKLNNPFKGYKYNKIIKDSFWNGSYFVDDLSGKDYIAGDANTFPYWTKLFAEKAMFKKSLNSIKDEGLDQPLPLKYTAKPIKGQYLRLPSFFIPNYEGNTIWLHLGGCFMETVTRFFPGECRDYLERFERLIEHHRTFPEVLNPNGMPYRTSFYQCDEGMLWSAIPLRIHERKCR